MLIERQVITTWHKPNERTKPINGDAVIATVSYDVGSCHYDHVFEKVSYWKESGFELYDEDEVDNLVVHAWADLEPYGGD